MPEEAPKTPTDLIPPKEAARRLGISLRTLRRIRQRGQIEVVLVSPGRVAVTEAALAAYIQRKTIVERSSRLRRSPKRRRRA